MHDADLKKSFVQADHRVPQPAKVLAAGQTSKPNRQFVAEAVEGLEEFVANELLTLKDVGGLAPVREGVQFKSSGTLGSLMTLRSAQAVYVVERFDVPRPKALLGDQYLRRLTGAMDQILAAHPRGTFCSIRVSAAGAESAVMLRLTGTLATHARLERQDTDGDLLLRVRRSSDTTWEVLLRISPRPLATRAWRECNYEGALNAPVARVMNRMLRGERLQHPTLLNLCCGSGTLMIERDATSGVTASGTQGNARVFGCDIRDGALACARINIAAAMRLGDLQSAPVVTRTDVLHLPFETGSIDGLVADLPFGNLVGNHSQNVVLYPAVLREAARVARRGARFVLISNEARLMARALGEQSGAWKVESSRRVVLGGLHPTIYCLVRV